MSCSLHPIRIGLRSAGWTDKYLDSLSSYSHISCPCLLLAKFKGKPEEKRAWVVQSREAMLLGHIAGQRMVLGLWVYVGGD